MSAKPRFFTPKTFRESASKGDDVSNGVIVKVGPCQIEQVKNEAGEDKDLTQLWTISTGAVDRDKDTLDVDGWELDNFLRGGAILWAHRRDLPPVAKPLDVFVEDAKLKSTAEFTPKDISAFGFMIHEMAKHGFVRSSSVGFKGLEWSFNEDRGFWAIDFKRQELLEWSPVPVPSNPEALSAAASSKGFDLSPLVQWTEKALDGGDEVAALIVSREDLEGCRKAIAPPKTTVVLGPNKPDADGTKTAGEGEAPNEGKGDGEPGPDAGAEPGADESNAGDDGGEDMIDIVAEAKAAYNDAREKADKLHKAVTNSLCDAVSALTDAIEQYTEAKNACGFSPSADAKAAFEDAAERLRPFLKNEGEPGAVADDGEGEGEGEGEGFNLEDLSDEDGAKVVSLVKESVINAVRAQFTGS